MLTRSIETFQKVHYSLDTGHHHQQLLPKGGFSMSQNLSIFVGIDNSKHKFNACAIQNPPCSVNEH